MIRSRGVSLVLAGLTTVSLLLWANIGLSTLWISFAWLLVGLLGALASIWLAWNPRERSFHEQDRSFDHTFTEL